MTTLRVLADDLTGALECATAFYDGTPVPVHFGNCVEAPDAVQVVSTDSRNVQVASLESILAACMPWFSSGDLAFKKVDSLLRGNTFHEVAWLAKQRDFSAVIFAPAFPAQGRMTKGGKLSVTPTHTSVAVRREADHFNIVAALASTGLTAYHVNHQDKPVPAEGQVMVLNAGDDQALQYLASLHRHPDARRWLWCGSGALALALSGQLQRTGLSRVNASAMFEGLVVLVTSSRHPVIREQLDFLMRQQDANNNGSHWPLLLDLMEADELPLPLAQAALARKARRAVDAQPQPGVLVVVGGDTLLALCKAAGARGLRALPCVRPGWGHAQLSGGVWNGVRCHSRSGAFGDRRDLCELLQQINPVHH